MRASVSTSIASGDKHLACTNKACRSSTKAMGKTRTPILPMSSAILSRISYTSFSNSKLASVTIVPTPFLLVTKPSNSSRFIASRTGVRLQPNSCAS